MIKKFDSFLNEAARTKFPEYKIGDMVIIGSYHEFLWKTDLSRNWESYSKYATSSSLGALCKVAAIDTEKKEYAVELVDGILQTVYRGRRGGGSYVTSEGGRLVYLKAKQNQLTTEGIDIIQKLLKDNEYNPDEKVSVRISGEKSVSRKLEGVSIMKSIENKKLTYLVNGVSGTVEGKYIEKEVNVDDETSRDILAEEIAKILNTKKVEQRGNEYVYEVAKVDGKELIQGILFFKDDAERDKFADELQKFIDKRLDKNFQKVMNNGESSDVKVIKMGPGTYSWQKGTIKVDKIVQAAKNLGINVKEFLEKSRGRISGKKFGL